MRTVTIKGLINFSVLMYFLFMIFTNQIENYVVFVGFYASLLLCGAVVLYAADFYLQTRRIMVTLVLIITAAVNAFIVGNATINEIIFIGLFSWASLALASEELEEKTLLIAFGLNAAVVLYKFATVGVVSGQIYTSASRNFVSVYLMYPLVIYYSIVERKKKDINMLPLVIAWLISLFAQGRGGIISSTFFLVGVYLVKYRDMKSRGKIIATVFMLITVAVVMLNIATIFQSIGASSMWEMFARNGMKSSRTFFWPEYIELATGNVKNFLFGANVEKTYIGRELDGNPHNSFMELHMLNGIIGLGLIIIILVKNGIKSIRNRDYLFLVCMLSIVLRAFTDHVLWAAFGTPVLFYFMFYYDAIQEHGFNYLE